jgi:hypothetical protein
MPSQEEGFDDAGRPLSPESNLTHHRPEQAPVSPTDPAQEPVGGGAARAGAGNKQFWMPDKLCKACYNCELPFTMLRRRHHCRFCGQVSVGIGTWKRRLLRQAFPRGWSLELHYPTWWRSFEVSDQCHP